MSIFSPKVSNFGCGTADVGTVQKEKLMNIATG